MTAAFNIALPGSVPVEPPHIDPLAVMKWTLADDDRWVRAPFIRDGKGDRPAIDLTTRKDGK